MATPIDRPASVRWQDRAVFGDRHGVPWWAAVLIAIALTTAGLVLDVEIQNRLGLTFQACYFLGCVLAVLLVRRSGLFAPMVQPPLILAIAVPGLIVATARQPVNPIDVVQPLIQGFPTMALTTGTVLALCLFRYLRERDSRLTDRPAAEGDRAAPREPKTPRMRIREPRTTKTRTPEAGGGEPKVPAAKGKVAKGKVAKGKEARGGEPGKAKPGKVGVRAPGLKTAKGAETGVREAGGGEPKTPEPDPRRPRTREPMPREPVYREPGPGEPRTRGADPRRDPR